jgi:ribosomal protein S2
MKIYRRRLNIEALTQKFLNVGRQSNERNKANLDFLISTPSKQDHINLEKSYQTLRNSLLNVSKIISCGGRVLVYHNQGNTVSKPLKHFFIKKWTKGLISNFKRAGKTHKVFPNLVIVASENGNEQNAIASEVNRYKVSSVFMSNTNARQNGLFSIPGNTHSNTAVNAFLGLFKRAITLGLLKEVAKINPKRLKKYNTLKRLRAFKQQAVVQKEKMRTSSKKSSRIS